MNSKEKQVVDNLIFGLEILIKELKKYDISNYRLESKMLYINIISNMKTSMQLIKKGKVDAYCSVMRSTFESFYYLVALENDINFKIGMNKRFIEVQNYVKDIIINQKNPDYLVFKSITKNGKKTKEEKIDLEYYYEDLCKNSHVTLKKIENINIEVEEKRFKTIYATLKLDAILYLISYIFKFTNINSNNYKLIREVFNYIDVMFSTIFIVFIGTFKEYQPKFLQQMKDEYTKKYEENFEKISCNLNYDLNTIIKKFAEKKLAYQLNKNGYIKKYLKINS